MKIKNFLFHKFFLFLLFLSSFSAKSQGGQLDLSFITGSGFGGFASVNSIAIQTDGKIIAAGSFTDYNGTPTSGIVRINPNGTIDNTFITGTGFDQQVSTIAIQADGKIVAGGYFNLYNGTACNYIVRLNTNGSIDPSFNTGTGFSAYVWSLAIQTDGKIIAGGYFSGVNGTSSSYIARLNTNGSIDPLFNVGTAFNGYIYKVLVQPDGKILAAGTFTIYNGTNRKYIARINNDGSLDAAFNSTGTGFNSAILDLALQADGKIIAGGNFTSYNGSSYNRLARLNTTGTLDATFNIGLGFNATVHSIAIQSNGRILVGGEFTMFNGVSKNSFTRLNTTGTLDVSFDTGTGLGGGAIAPYALKIQPDDKILLGGNFNSYNGTSVIAMARVNAACVTPSITITSSDNPICPGNATTLSVSGASSYTWTPGSIISSSIVVSPTINTTYTVTASSGTCTTTNYLTLMIWPAPDQPTAIIGNTIVPEGSLQTYSVAPVNGATNYMWMLPSNWSGSSTSNVINVTPSLNSGSISVLAVNDCGWSSNWIHLSVMGTSTCVPPAKPTAISGYTFVPANSNQSYSVAPVADATSYAWYVLPSGFSPTTTTNNVTINVGSITDTLLVVAINSCGASPINSLVISIGTCSFPSQPGSITGNTNVTPASAQVYSIANVAGATSYNWTLPSGYSGSSTGTSINVTIGTNSGQISVRAINACGASSPANLAITVTGSGTTTAGSQLPVLVKDVATSFVYTNSDPTQFTSFAGKTYFVGQSGATDVPYYTDGTTAGTQALASGLILDFCSFLGEFKNRLYFRSYNNVTGMELWSTDGTAAGTLLLKDVNPSGDANPSMFTVVGNSLFFVANDGVHGTELWVTDGTEAGTHMTYDMEPSNNPSDGSFNGDGIALGNSIIFARHSEPSDRNDLWIMDNTGNNPATNLTQQFTGLYYLYSNATKKFLYNNKVYFNFHPGNEGDELFVTDGTVTGTQMWNMVPGTGGFSPNDFFIFNNKLCFTGYTTGIGCCPDLFVSDGTMAGTTSLNVYAVAPSYAINNNTLYFYGGDNTNGYELWKSDGTPSGTSMIKDIRVGGGSSGVNNLAWCAGKLYFTANDNINQNQPWVSDGTTGGTMMLKNIYSGVNGSFAKSFIEYNSRVFFTARLAFNDFHLFETNSTTAGTNTIQPIGATNSSNPLGENGPVVYYPTVLKITNGMIFMKANFHDVGRELYAIGASMVGIKDIDQLDESYVIYPNPSSGVFQIKSDGLLKEASIKVFNAQGQTVFESNKMISEIDLSQKPKGIYFLQITSEEKIINKKLIVQ